MSYVEHCKGALEATLDREFPKIDEEGPRKRANKRGPALLLFAEAMLLIKQAVRAFGGCESCYGKGYSTTTARGLLTMTFCGCERGEQLMNILVPKTRSRTATFPTLIKP